MITIYVEGDLPIKLGHTRDNEAYRVAFPIAQTIALFGDGGKWYILNKRPTEAVAYPVPDDQVTKDDNFLYWTITSTEVAYNGRGECQLSYTIGETTKMSHKWQTGICSSLISGGNPPSYIESWLNQLTDIKDTAVEAKDQAVESAEAIEDMEVSAVQLPYTETAYVNKTIDPETGNYHLEFGIPKGKDGAGGALRFIYVNVLPPRPEEGEENSIYCIPIDTPSPTDRWQGYRWIEEESRWESWGGATIDLTDYAKLEDLPRVAVAVYGVTPFATIKDLASEGYAVFCAYYDGSNGYRTYPLSNITGASAIFVVPFYTDSLSGVQFREAKCLKVDNSWSHRTYYAELQSNKTNVIDTSVVHYPSNKAVSDVLASYVKNGEDTVIVESSSGVLRLDSDTRLTANSISFSVWSKEDVLTVGDDEVVRYNGDEVATVNNIPDNTFVATYGTTTKEQISAQLNNGKNVICLFNNWLYRAVNSDRFESFDATSKTVRYLKIATNNTWSNGSFTLTNVASSTANVGSGGGMYVKSDNTLTFDDTTYLGADRRTTWKRGAVTNHNIDEYVKVALTDGNGLALTDAEKVAAQDFLGVTDLVGDVHAALQELLGGEMEATV